MKIFFLISFLIFQLQIDDSIIKIEKNKDSYSLNNDVNYSVTNNSNKKMIYFVGLEVFEKEWIPTINDITRPKFKVAPYLNLDKSVITHKKIKLKKVLFYDRNFNSKKFRLVIFYKLEGDTTKRMQYSKSFIIKK